MNRRAALAVVTLAAVGVAGSVPALAAKPKPKPKPKPISGTFSYTDVTPDPTVTANSDAASHCHGNVPAGPADVNSHTLKVKGKGLLTVVGKNALDWAMEVRDSKGLVLAGSDGTNPNDPEGTVVTLPKAGSYLVVYCNLEGEPTVSATYKYVYR
jgi:hypothetical protein